MERQNFSSAKIFVRLLFFELAANRRRLSWDLVRGKYFCGSVDLTGWDDSRANDPSGGASPSQRRLEERSYSREIPSGPIVRDAVGQH